jgi:hypothetical protein
MRDDKVEKKYEEQARYSSSVFACSLHLPTRFVDSLVPRRCELLLFEGCSLQLLVTLRNIYIIINYEVSP